AARLRRYRGCRGLARLARGLTRPSPPSVRLTPRKRAATIPCTGPRLLAPREESAVIVDWQHHYVPRAAAEAQGYRPGGNAQVLHNGLSRTTLHDRLYDLDWQRREMDEAGIDVAVLTCQLGWDAPLPEARRINDGL